MRVGRHQGRGFIIKPAGSKIRGRPAVIKRVQQRSAPRRKTLAPRKAGSAALCGNNGPVKRTVASRPVETPATSRCRARRRPRAFSRGSDTDGSRAIPVSARDARAGAARGAIHVRRREARDNCGVARVHEGRVNHLIVSENRGCS